MRETILSAAFAQWKYPCRDGQVSRDLPVLEAQFDLVKGAARYVVGTASVLNAYLIPVFADDPRGRQLMKEVRPKTIPSTFHMYVCYLQNQQGEEHEQEAMV